MFSLAHIVIAASLCGIMYSIIELIPDLFKVYQERYRVNLSRTSRELERFFLNVKPTKIMIGVGVLGLLAGIGTQSWVLGIAVAAAGLFAPRVALNIWKDIRSSRVEAQLMDALIVMSNSLKSGLDIAAGIERVSLTMKPPISEEFSLVVNSYRLGTPLEIALMDVTERIRSRTLETVVYAISIQRETGGNIIKIFDQLIVTIREEAKLQKKVSAMTSQGRTQILFLAIFPWMMAGLFYALSPDLMRPALENPWGQLIVLLLVVWEVIGVVFTKKIVTVDI